MTFIEKQTGSHIRALRSDGEFDSHHLKDLCWEVGIEREESEEGLDIPSKEPIERLLEEIPAKRQPAWCRQILQEAEGHAAPKGTFRESRKPQRYSGLAAQVDPIICEPSSFEEAAKLQVWKDAMLEEYNSILTNDVWDVVPRPQGKSVVTSK